MHKTRVSIEKQLKLAQVALTNAFGDHELQEALTVFGYGAGRLSEGQALYDHARTLYQEQRSSYGALAAAIDALALTRRQAHTNYMRYITVTRVALKRERGPLQALGLLTPRQQRLAGWLAQARQFYAKALADSIVLGRLAEFGISQAMLEAGQREVEAVAAAEASRHQHQGVAQDTTRLSLQADAALDEWMRDFTKIARVALQSRPQFLAKLGIATSARRGARTRTASAPLADTAVIAAEPPSTQATRRRATTRR